MATIGEQLKQARTQKGVSLEEVQSKAKIQAKFLQAMEEDDFEQILSPTYRRSFLEKYAQYLGLDSKALLKEYLAAYPEKTNIKVRIEEEEDKFKSVKKSLFPEDVLKTAIIVFLALVVIAAGVVVLKAKSSNKAVKKEQAVKQSEEKRALLVPLGQPLRLVISVKDDAWLKISQDGKLIFQNTLAKGKTKKIIAQDKIEIWTGKAEAVFLSLNGKYLGPAGRGVVKNIVITHEGLKK